MLGLEHPNRVLDFALGQVHHGIARRFLVTRIGERVQRERVLIRRDDRLLDQATDYARFFLVQFFEQ